MRHYPRGVTSLFGQSLFRPNKIQFFNSSITQWSLKLGYITARGNVVLPVYIQHSTASACIRDVMVKTKNDNKQYNDMNKRKLGDKYYKHCMK